MTRNLAATMVLALVLGGFAGVAFGQAPPINLPEDELRASPLPPNCLPPIKARIKYCLTAIATSQDAAEVKRASTTLIENGYNRYPDSASYRDAYGKEVAVQTPTVLAKLDDARSLTLAMALAQMPEPSALEIFKVLAVNPNAAVRFIAWKVLANPDFRAKALATKDQTLKVLDIADKQFRVEISPAVVAQMLQGLRPQPGADKAVTAQSWKLVKFVWESIGYRMAEGSPEMTHACRVAVTLVGELGQGDKESVQKLLDMMFYSAKAYADGKGEGLVAETNAQLLREAEPLLVTITGIQKKFVQDALAGKDAKERASKVKLAVVEDWVDALKAKYKDIKEPKLPTATTESAEPK